MFQLHIFKVVNKYFNAFRKTKDLSKITVLYRYIYLISKAFKFIGPECLFQPAHCAFRNDIHWECL